MIIQRRKKIIIIIMILVVLVLSYGVYSVFQNNYRLGSDLYNAVNRAWIQSYNIVDSIDSLEQELEDPDGSTAIIDRHYFDESIQSVYFHFGFGVNMPFLEEVSLKWYARFTEIYQQTRSNEELQAMFSNGEMKIFRDQVNHMVQALADFSNSYQQMSDWERHWISWKNAQESLSEQVRIN